MACGVCNSPNHNVRTCPYEWPARAYCVGASLSANGASAVGSMAMKSIGITRGDVPTIPTI